MAIQSTDRYSLYYYGWKTPIEAVICFAEIADDRVAKFTSLVRAAWSLIFPNTGTDEFRVSIQSRATILPLAFRRWANSGPLLHAYLVVSSINYSDTQNLSLIKET